jgi:anti-sigma factor RsiW
MFVMNRHLTDREIVQGLDGELSESRRFAVVRHLDECAACRARHAAIAWTSSAVSADYRAHGTSGPQADRSRARLTIALAQEARERNQGRLVFAAVIVVAAVVVLAASATMYRQGATAARSNMAGHGLALPVGSITPGATRDVSVDQLCAGPARMPSITAAMRAAVLKAYGVEGVPTDQYELDYLITPELGGATDTRNLWPQRYGSPIWNARVKDELERLLPQLVCRNKLDLKTAQRDMAVDWVTAYQKYFNTDLPLAAHRGPAIHDDETFDGYLSADAGRAPAIRLVSLAVLR